MDPAEKAIEVLTRAEKHGLHLEFDSGLLVAKRTEYGDPQMQDDIIAEIGRHLRAVRRLVSLRAVAVRANAFVGQRIWSEEGEGVLASGSGDGDLAITITKEGFRHRQTLMTHAESFLVIVDEAKADEVSSSGDEPATAKTGGGLFKRLMS
jgi:hypothetical protein